MLPAGYVATIGLAMRIEAVDRHIAIARSEDARQRWKSIRRKLLLERDNATRAVPVAHPTFSDYYPPIPDACYPPPRPRRPLEPWKRAPRGCWPGWNGDPALLSQGMPPGFWRGWDGDPSGLSPVLPPEHDPAACAVHPPQSWPAEERWPHDCRGGVRLVRPRRAPRRDAARSGGDYQDADGRTTKTPKGRAWDGLPWSLVGQDDSSIWASLPLLPRFIAGKQRILNLWGGRPDIVLHETAWDGLMEAAESFDPAKGKFFTYAWRVIVNHIKDEVKQTRKNRRDDRVPVGSVALISAAGLVSGEQWWAIKEAFYALHTDHQTVLQARGYYPDDEQWPVRRFVSLMRDRGTTDMRTIARMHWEMAKSSDCTLANRTIANISRCSPRTTKAQFNAAMDAYRQKVNEKLNIVIGCSLKST